MTILQKKRIFYGKQSTLNSFSILLLISCSASKKNLTGSNNSDLLKSLNLYVEYLNERDFESLLKLYDKEYQSFSPLIQPNNLNSFILQTLQNLDKNNFMVFIQIREISAGSLFGHTTVNWQLKTKGQSKDTDPFANVQRHDLWKKDNTGRWKIYRTTIYNEKAF